MSSSYPVSFPVRRSPAETHRLSSRRRVASRRTARRTPTLTLESLERRALLAVTAAVFGSELQISLGAADDVAYLSNDGTSYIVRGTDITDGGFTVGIAEVDSVSVMGTAGANQSFTVAAGVADVLTDPLTVGASVEKTTVVGAINATGDVLIDSAAITLAADVTTTGQQRYKGATGLVGDRTLSAGAGNVSFESTVDSSPEVFADPDAFATGTDLTSVFPGITLSAVGTNDTGVAVTSAVTKVATTATGDFAPTGNRAFAGSTVDWNSPGNVFKAAFAAEVTSVSLDFASNDENDTNAYLEAYDSSGNLLASATFPPAIPEFSFVTLTVSAPNIAYVLASFDSKDGSSGLLDNLRAGLATTPAASLTVNTTGTTTFSNAVGGGNALASLTTDAGGTTIINGGSVKTSGASGQVYNDAVEFGGDTTLTDTSNGTIAFKNTVDSFDATARSLTVNTGGSTEFGDGGADYVGSTNRLLSLTTDAGGTTTFWVDPSSDTTPSVRTQNDQVYADAVKLRANTTLTSVNSGRIAFNSTVDSFDATPRSLNVNSGGSTEFGDGEADSVGGTNALLSLITDAGGTVSLKSVTTTGAQSYGDDTTTLDGTYTTTNSAFAVAGNSTLAGNTTVSTGAGAGDITFGGTLDGAKQAALAAGSGAISFKAAVGSTTPLAGITLTTAASTTADSTVKLSKAADSGQDGLTVAAGVNNVTMTSSGSSVTGFAGTGISFVGGSTNSRLSGFTVSGNGGNGMRFAAGSYAGTTLTANTISDNGDKTNHVGDGILVQGSSLMIGWDANPASNTTANTINNNALNGIRIDGIDAINNTILSNSIFLNGHVSSGSVVGDGIALTNGGNGSQIAPRILDIVRDTKENKVRVQFIVDAAGSYLVQFFQNTAADERSLFPADANGFEGRAFIAERPVSTVTTAGTGKPVIDGTPVVTGNALQTIEFDASLLTAGDWLTATATLLDGTTPTNTSPFSAGVQTTETPVLAAGGDGQSTFWDREFAYTATGATTLQIGGLNAAQAAFFAKGTTLTVASAGRNATTTVTVSETRFNPRTARATITLSGAIPAGSGTLVLGQPSLPSARLVNAADTTQIELEVNDSAISTALEGVPGLTVNQRAAFVSRFQGGLRVATGDFDGDGYIDLVTAPGGVPAKLQPSVRNVFGSAARVITVHNGNPSGTWKSASIDVGAVFGSQYLDGFLVTVGNVRSENSGSGNATVELIVASTRKVAVFDVTVSARGGTPTIVASPARWELAGTITGLASGTFSGPVGGLADVVVASTTATSKTAVTALNTTTVSVFKPAGGVSPFKVNDRVWNGDPAKPGTSLVNVFLNGASLAVGDIDNTIDQKPELILGAGAGGLGNFRVLSADVVAGANQPAVDAALGRSGIFSHPARSGVRPWQPSGGPDYFVGQAVPAPVGAGFNAPLSMAVVESNGKDFKAEVFAALGSSNQTGNQIRSFVWNSGWSGTDWHSPEGTNRLRKGAGLRLG